MEQGPTTTIRRSSWPCNTREISRRLRSTSSVPMSCAGSHSSSSAGVISGRTARMRVSSMRVVSCVESGRVAGVCVVMGGIFAGLSSTGRCGHSGLRFLQPDAAAGIGQAKRHVLLEKWPVKVRDERIHQQDPEAAVELQEGSQDIQLVPGTAETDPLFWILERVKDIVEMNHDAWRERGQDVEEQAIDVAVDLAHVGRVDEQDVAGAQAPEQVEFDILQALGDDLDAGAIGLADQ